MSDTIKSTNNLYQRTINTGIFAALFSFSFCFSGLIFVIAGLIFAVYSGIGFLGLMFAGLIFIIFSALALRIFAKNYFVPYREVKKLKAMNNSEKLLELLALQPVEGRKYDIKANLALLGLLEIAPEKLVECLYNNPNLLDELGYNSLLRDDLMFKLTSRLGYSTVEEMHSTLFGKIENKTTRSSEKYSEIITASEEKIDQIPITKVYFIEKSSQPIKSMVSGLQLDFSIDKIVACPFCGGMAEKELLLKWLAENHLCPVCRSKLMIDHCPLVKLE